MAVISELLCEGLASILHNLDDVRHLLPVMLACGQFYLVIEKNRIIAAELLRRQLLQHYCSPSWKHHVCRTIARRLRFVAVGPSPR
jgi:hypothetical protein